MNVKRVEDLREIANETLSGLEAGPALRRRILNAGRAPARAPRAGWLTGGKLAAALSFVLLLAVVIPLSLRGGDEGGPVSVPPVRVMGAATDGPQFRDLPAGSEQPAWEERASSLQGQVDVSEARGGDAQGIWTGTGSSFSLIGVSGRYYRLLTVGSLREDQLGESLGFVTVHTDEPALSDPSAIVSNHAPVNAEVFAVRGMGRTLVACTVDGKLCLYQRVSFGGKALADGERRLTDVLQLTGHVTKISLSGGADVEGPEAEALFGILADSAEYVGRGGVSGRQVLIITLDNGASVQMNVDGDRLSSCGEWSCPEFFEALDAR